MSTLINTIFFDPPIVLDAAVTAIPASSALPLQVIANTGDYTTGAINFSDSTNEFIGVYKGPVGQEILIATIGNGVIGQAWARILPNSRISLRSLTNIAITVGKLTANLSGDL